MDVTERNAYFLSRIRFSTDKLEDICSVPNIFSELPCHSQSVEWTVRLVTVVTEDLWR